MNNIFPPFFSPPWPEPLVRNVENYVFEPFLNSNGSIVFLPGEKRYIGEKSNQICRFCKKDKSMTRFKSTAHAIPELLGNKSIISYEECDACNKFFATSEDHLGKMLNFINTLKGIKGKNGIPNFSLKIPSQNSAFIMERANEKDIHIEATEDHYIIDELNKTLRLNVQTPPFIPYEIWRSLTKMAFSLLDAKYLNHYEFTRKHLLTPRAESLGGFVPPRILFHKLPGLCRYIGIQHVFLRRTADIDNFYMWYSFAYDQFAFLLPLVSDIKDSHLANRLINVPIPPFPLFFIRDSDADIDLRYISLDSSNKEKISSNFTCTFSFKNMFQGSPQAHDNS